MSRFYALKLANLLSGYVSINSDVTKAFDVIENTDISNMGSIINYYIWTEQLKDSDDNDIKPFRFAVDFLLSL